MKVNLVDVGYYNFNASEGEVLMYNIKQELRTDNILMVFNTTRNEVIYQFNNPSLGGTVSGNILNLNYDTSSMSNDDELLIYLEIDTEGLKDTTITDNLLEIHFTLNAMLNELKKLNTHLVFINDFVVDGTEVD